MSREDSTAAKKTFVSMFAAHNGTVSAFHALESVNAGGNRMLPGVRATVVCGAPQNATYPIALYDISTDESREKVRAYMHAQIDKIFDSMTEGHNEQQEPTRETVSEPPSPLAEPT